MKTVPAEDNVQFATAIPSQRYEALRLVCSRDTRHADSKARQLLQLMSDGSMDPAGLITARRGSKLVGAILAQRLPGRSAVMWPAQLVSPEFDETACELAAHSVDWLSRQQVAFVQCAVLPFDDDAARRLAASDFAPLADIRYLVAARNTFPVEYPADSLVFTPVEDSSDLRDALQDTILATYEDSLDCPALNGVRPIADILEGHRGTGVHRPEWWLLVRYSEQTVGCLLVTDHPQEQQAELVYMGLVPQCRGRGWAYAITRHAQWLAHSAGRQKMVVAVDEFNLPALKAYRRAGFWSWDRRHVWFRSLTA